MVSADDMLMDSLNEAKQQVDEIREDNCVSVAEPYPVMEEGDRKPLLLSGPTRLKYQRILGLARFSFGNWEVWFLVAKSPYSHAKVIVKGGNFDKGTVFNCWQGDNDDVFGRTVNIAYEHNVIQKDADGATVVKLDPDDNVLGPDDDESKTVSYGFKTVKKLYTHKTFELGGNTLTFVTERPNEPERVMERENVRPLTIYKDDEQIYQVNL